jgi:protein-S-isoprenylcysteine O-methyltransferase Ste14
MSPSTHETNGKTRNRQRGNHLPMSRLALALYVVYLLLAFGLRMLIQLRRTGSTGFRGLSGRPGSAEWVAGVGFVLAALLGAAAPVLALLDVAEPIAALDVTLVHAVGLVLASAGIVATFYAQLAMGNSWRIGVEPGERTELVTAGPFALVRNPIYAAILPTALGLALLVPSWVALAGFSGLVGALELQVRVVEEPYLRQVHGESFAAYATRVGRFVPGVGRLRP